MERYCDDILQYFIDDVKVREHWYKARYYIMNVLRPLDGHAIGCDSGKKMHVVVNWHIGNADDKQLMLAVVRQICLLFHFPNYDEENGRNRTRITILASREADVAAAYDDMRSYPYLGALLDYCKCEVEGDPNREHEEVLPLDVEFVFKTGEEKGAKDDIVIAIDPKDVVAGIKDFSEEYMKFDVTKGMLVSMVYNTGVEIDNLPANDNANINRYSTALNVFCYKLKPDLIQKKWDESAKRRDDGTYDEVSIKNKLSSVFCADCFEPRIRSLFDKEQKALSEYILMSFREVMEKISEEKTITAFARCEHARWNVEKLILGFKPLTMQDWYEIERRFGKERNDFIKGKKKKGWHIDLCSYKNLRRVNPADMKYDYFLMLAMPQILRSYLLSK